MGTVNAHIRTESNRCILFSIVQDLKLDVCVVCETWFDSGTSDSIVLKTFGPDFIWFGKERVNQKGGGIGFLARKNLGSFLCIKGDDHSGVVWIKLTIPSGDKYFFGAVYIPPIGSISEERFKEILTHLEADMIKFRQEGKVIVLGDFNARIFNAPSTINRSKDCISLHRTVSDIMVDPEKKAQILSRGKQLINCMNASSMIVLNGLDSGGGTTFFKIVKKKVSS